MKNGDRFDSTIEVLGQEVEEDLGPEEALYGGDDLILGNVSLELFEWERRDNIQTAAVRMISLAQ